jgi:hypothetical protein
MKKIIILSILFFLAVAPHVFAATTATSGFTALAPIPGLTDANTVNSASGLNMNTLAVFFNNLYKYMVGLAAILAVVMIIYAGIRIAVNKDNVSVLMDSKSQIWQAILGLVLVLSPALVFSIINPSILNLSLNLPKLDTTTPATASQAATSNPATASQAATSNIGPTALNNVWVCTNNDCTIAVTTAKSSSNCSSPSVPTLYCVPSQSNPNNLAVPASTAPLQNQSLMQQTCPSGQTLVVVCSAYYGF